MGKPTKEELATLLDEGEASIRAVLHEIVSTGRSVDTNGLKDLVAADWAERMSRYPGPPAPEVIRGYVDKLFDGDNFEDGGGADPLATLGAVRKELNL